MRTVIVGASLAGVRAAESLRSNGLDGELILVGAERELPYERPPLSKELLAGEVDRAALRLQPESFYVDRRIELELGRRASAFDPIGRTIRFDDGGQLEVDRLLIATGAAPRRLGVEGEDLDGVVSLRTLADAIELRDRLARARRVVVVGGGLLGLEIAAAAVRDGRSVTVLEADSVPLRRIAGPLGAAVAALHRGRGVDVRVSSKVVAIRGARGVDEVVLGDGSRIGADLVVVAVGVAPATGWLEGSGIALDDGVLTNALGETSIEGVWAAGDVARAFSPHLGRAARLESYGNAHSQGVAIGRSMLGDAEPFAGVPAASSVQHGVRIQSLGEVIGAHAIVTRGEPGRPDLLAFFLRGDRVVGAFGLDRPRDVLVARRLVTERRRVRPDDLADPRRPLVEVVAASAA